MSWRRRGLVRILELTIPSHPVNRVQRFGVHDDFTFDSIIKSLDGWIIFHLNDGREVLFKEDDVMSMIYFDDGTEPEEPNGSAEAES